MSAVFADSYYFLARLNPADAAHAEAVRVGSEEARTLVTTAWVLTEVADAMSSPANRLAFLRLLKVLRESPDAEIIPAGEHVWEQGIKLYSERPDKEWSLTDCISFGVMANRGITDALTGDRHLGKRVSECC